MVRARRRRGTGTPSGVRPHRSSARRASPQAQTDQASASAGDGAAASRRCVSTCNGGGGSVRGFASTIRSSSRAGRSSSSITTPIKPPSRAQSSRRHRRRRASPTSSRSTPLPVNPASFTADGPVKSFSRSSEEKSISRRLVGCSSPKRRVDAYAKSMQTASSSGNTSIDSARTRGEPGGLGRRSVRVFDAPRACVRQRPGIPHEIAPGRADGALSAAQLDGVSSPRCQIRLKPDPTGVLRSKPEATSLGSR